MDHLFLTDLPSNDADLRPFLACPNFDHSKLVDADEGGLDAKAAEEAGEVVEAEEGLIVGVNGVGEGEVCEVVDVNGYSFDVDGGDGL